MEKIIRYSWVILLCLFIGFTSCKKKEKEKPEMATESEVEEASENTEEFFEALEDHDFEEAKEHVTPETQPVLEIVMEDAKKQERLDGDKPEIKVEILERTPQIGKVNLKVKIMVGPKTKVETLTLVPVEGEWRIVMPRKNLALLRLVVIHQSFEVILVKEKNKKFHPGKGHAYGHRKHGDDN
jgi:hypothetical protein